METNAHAVHSAYQRGQVSSAGPLRIVVLMYEGAIRFGGQALEKFDDPAARGGALGRMHRVVSELLSALDRDQGGEIAGNLDALYTYALDAITQANVSSDRKALESVIEVLQTLLAGWRGIESVSSSGVQGGAR